METETITIVDAETGEEYRYTAEKWIQCEHCGYQWQSESEMTRPSCSDCHRRTDRNYVLRYSFFSKQTCWLEERVPVAEIRQRVAEELEADVDSVDVKIDRKGNLAARVGSELAAFEFYATRSLASSIPKGELDEGSLEPLGSVDQENDRWPTRAPQEVEPYAASLRRWARKLELLEENGWELTESNGEYLYFEIAEDVEVDEPAGVAAEEGE